MTMTIFFLYRGVMVLASYILLISNTFCDPSTNTGHSLWWYSTRPFHCDDWTVGSYIGAIVNCCFDVQVTRKWRRRDAGTYWNPSSHSYVCNVHIPLMWVFLRLSFRTPHSLVSHIDMRPLISTTVSDLDDNTGFLKQEFGKQQCRSYVRQFTSTPRSQRMA